ncbi:alkaline phosphatase D family protein [Sphingomonas arantia]|uniref:Alkaline phosphatase D family protein n=1 Tax=Sphingomonas arantia TaxID=1460676 RepID=A0ABW4TZN7_9SPHN
MTVDRRTALSLIGMGTTLAAPGVAAAAAAPAITFVHGVASGDPTPGGAILWTRATPSVAGHAGDIPVVWTVTDGDGAAPVATGRAVARAARDFTVKVEPKGLKPGHDYSFFFTAADGTKSPVGRFCTLPVGAVQDAVLAVVSCSLYNGGLFNAYDAIAQAPRVDAVVHLGDYIYEYGIDGYGGEIGKRLGRTLDPTHEIVTLDDYRRRHAWYKKDADLQAAHARAAFICVWDDHETANDSWIGGAENHQPNEGDWGKRKAAAMQAYFEWMPIRDPIPGRPHEAINRSFQFGDLASLIMVETRLLARSHQAVFKNEVATPDQYGVVKTIRADPKREMLGPDQARWLEGELSASVKAGKPWQVLGNQVVMARVAGPDLAKALGPQVYAATMAAMPAMYRTALTAAAESFRAGIPFSLDSWDGYPPARERLYASFRAAGSRPLVISGDSHAFWANDLHDDAGQLVAAEFGTSAITSPSYGSLLPNANLGKIIADANPEVAFCDQDNKGYILLTLTPQSARGDYLAMSTIMTKPYTVKTVASYTVSAADRTSPMRLVG